MIDLYCSDTGNSVRALIALEECGLPYRRQFLDLGQREHKTEAYLQLNPFGVVPTMVDHEGPHGGSLTLSQSTAILYYASEKSGKFLADTATERAQILQWCLFAASDASPTSQLLLYMTTQLTDLTTSAQQYLERRFISLMRGVEAHFERSSHDYLVERLSLADFALYPVVRMRRHLIEAAGGFPRLLRWAERVGGRRAVVRATTFT